MSEWFDLEEDDLVQALKDGGYTPKWFGVGFIQVKVTPELRYHFWHPELTATVGPEEIHDHRYNFRSSIISGRLDQTIYGFLPYQEGGYTCYDVSCSEATPGIQPGSGVNGEPYEIVKMSLREGSDYYLHAGVFHRVEAPHLCASRVRRGEALNQFARVIQPISGIHVCPFANPLPEARLWRLMDEVMRFSLDH